MPIDIIQNIEKGVLPNTATTQLFLMDVEKFLDALPMQPIFDLVVTSPPYNIGKEYENQVPLSDYYDWQKRIIEKIYPRLKDNGSICWQVGNYVENGSITPLDIELAPIFKELNLHLRNRIIWHFGHGLHNKNRFSGRYEVIMWYTKSDTYTFNLDDVRVPAKYPGKRSYRGENKGKLSGNPKGKNPEDVWEIPNVKGNHIEKTNHPCQFPVGLIERLVLALTNENDLVFDPFSGVASSGVAALLKTANDTSYNTALALNARSEAEIKAHLESIGFKRSLTINQLNNLKKISHLPGAATFSVPGAGKTTEALAFFFVNATDIDRLLVVAPKNAFSAWDEQLDACMGENYGKFVRLRGGEAAIQIDLRTNPRFMLITYVFHLWCLSNSKKMLAVISPDELLPYIPTNNLEGQWESAKIPFSCFEGQFVEIA